MSDEKVLRRAAELAAAGLVPESRRQAIERVGERYAIGVTAAVAALIDRADPKDPVARQFIPRLEELDRRPEESTDPIGDGAFSPLAGLVHRYPDRVLLKLSHLCKVYCRFCFRREMVGPGRSAPLSPQALDAAIAYIAARPSIWETIITGGDPLALSPRRLGEVMERLRPIEHLRVVRLHTRAPCVDPEAVDDEMIAALRRSDKTVYVALHANHPREMTKAARAACARLVDAGISMLSQSVLLAGVNDDVETLGALMRAFVEARVKPYYLHHLDLAPGVAHFRVEIERGREIMRALRGTFSGLCQPSYMIDLPGGHGKVPIGPDYVAQGDAPGRYEIADPNGRRHAYPPSGQIKSS